MAAILCPAVAAYELRFESLFDAARALVFPCDARGQVDLGLLPLPARRNYVSACARVGRDYATPRISPALPPR